MKHERIYLNSNDDRVYIDTYVVNNTRMRDAMLVIPGGGYCAVCTEKEGEPIALEFVQKGYNAFVLNYRVGKDDIFPNQLLDAASAMIYIREHAEELHINPNRVFAVGFSAGGHLCASICTMFDYPEVKSVFGDKYVKVRPTGGILSYPVTVMHGPAHFGSFINLLGKQPSEFTEDEINRLSIERVVNSNTAPMFIWHTVEDEIVPVKGSLMLAEALVDANVPFRMSIYPYGPHGISLGTEITKTNEHSIQDIASSWTYEADQWMKTVEDYEFK